MTDNEIIKALECCKDAKLNQDCLDLKCPFATEYGCNIDAEELRNAALDLINRQKAEIEKYRHIKETLNEFWDILLRVKIAKRKEEPTLEEFAEAIQEIQAEAIKEFAERIKKHLLKNGFIWCSEVEKIVDEMTDNTFTKVEHNSLCETETFEGRC